MLALTMHAGSGADVGANLRRAQTAWARAEDMACLAQHRGSYAGVREPALQWLTSYAGSCVKGLRYASRRAGCHCGMCAARGGAKCCPDCCNEASVGRAAALPSGGAVVLARALGVSGGTRKYMNQR